MPINADLAYDLSVPCGDYDYHVPRTLGLVKRIEQVFGAIEPLQNRLDKCDLPLVQLAYLIDILLADVPAHEDRPKRAAIESWLFAYGIHRPSRKLAQEIITLIMGNEILDRIIATKRGLTAAEGQVVGPFAPTAASSGRIG